MQRTAFSNALRTSRSVARRGTAPGPCRGAASRCCVLPASRRGQRDAATRSVGRRCGTARRRLQCPPATRRRRRRSASADTSACTRSATRSERKRASRWVAMTMPTVGFTGNDERRRRNAEIVQRGLRSRERWRGGCTRAADGTDDVRTRRTVDDSGEWAVGGARLLQRTAVAPTDAVANHPHDPGGPIGGQRGNRSVDQRAIPAL